MEIYFPDNFKSPLRGEDLSGKGETVTARVEALLPDGRARLSIFNNTLDVDLPAGYKAGDTVRFTVKESGGKLVLELVPDSAATAAGASKAAPTVSVLIAELGVPDVPENVAAFKALVSAGVPATAENVLHAAGAGASAGLSAEDGVRAAAFLLKNGLPVDAAFVRGAAALLSDGSALAASVSRLMSAFSGVTPSENIAAVFAELSGALEGMFAASDAEGLQAALAKGFSARAARALALVENAATAVSSGRADLAVVDTLLAELDQAGSADGGKNYSAKHASALIQKLLADGSRDLDAARFILRNVAAGERAALGAELAAIERNIAQKDPALRALGEMHRELGGLLERATVLKALGVSHGQGEVSFAEVIFPAVIEGQVVRFKFTGKKAGKKKKRKKGAPVGVRIDVETSALGRVLGDIKAVEKDLHVGFTVTGVRVYEVFKKHAAALESGLAQMGFTTEVAIGRADECIGLFREELSAGGGDIRIIDVQA